MSEPATVLPVDDEVRSVETMSRILDEALQVRTATNVTDAERIPSEDWIDASSCDQRVPQTTGVHFLAGACA